MNKLPDDFECYKNLPNSAHEGAFPLAIHGRLFKVNGTKTTEERCWEVRNLEKLLKNCQGDYIFYNSMPGVRDFCDRRS